MVIKVGGDPFETQRNNARSFKAELCNKTFDKNTIDKHLNDCIANPTIGLIAGRRECGPHYQCKLKHLKKYTELNDKINIFEAMFKELYPKTGNARLRLIKNENIVFYGHKPIGIIRNCLKYVKKNLKF